MLKKTKKKESNKHKRIAVYLVFLSISTFLWLLIKLNNVYTMNMPVQLRLYDPLPGIWLENDQINQRLDIKIQSTGFVLLRLSIIHRKEPTISASLQSLSPRKISQDEYYVTLQSLRNLLTAYFGLNADQIILPENELRLKVQILSQKKVKVEPNLEIYYEPQFGPYGSAKINPDSVTIFAVEQVIDTLKFVYTKKHTYKHVKNDIKDSLDLMFLHPSMGADTKKVYVLQQVEKFTEAEITAVIEQPGSLYLKLFPNRTKLLFNVALKDYDQIDANDFLVELDTTGLERRLPQLFLKVTKLPDNVQFVRLEPEKVEYLIPSFK